MKEILLGHPGIVAEIFGLPPGEPVGHDPLHPHIQGEGFQPVEPIEQGTFRHFGAYAVDKHEGFPGLIQFHVGDGPKINGAVRYQPGGGEEVFGPESCPEGSQLFQRRGGQPLGCREEEFPLWRRLSQGFSQPLDNPLNPGNVVVLGDYKGA